LRAAAGRRRERELQKKNAELARVLECLQGPDLSPGLARELKKQATILEAQIAELELVPGRHK